MLSGWGVFKSNDNVNKEAVISVLRDFILSVKSLKNPSQGDSVLKFQSIQFDLNKKTDENVEETYSFFLQLFKNIKEQVELQADIKEKENKFSEEFSAIILDTLIQLSNSGFSKDEIQLLIGKLNPQREKIVINLRLNDLARKIAIETKGAHKVSNEIIEKLKKEESDLTKSIEDLESKLEDLGIEKHKCLNEQNNLDDKIGELNVKYIELQRIYRHKKVETFEGEFKKDQLEMNDIASDIVSITITKAEFFERSSEIQDQINLSEKELDILKTKLPQIKKDLDDQTKKYEEFLFCSDHKIHAELTDACDLIFLKYNKTDKQECLESIKFFIDLITKINLLSPSNGVKQILLKSESFKTHFMALTSQLIMILGQQHEFVKQYQKSTTKGWIDTAYNSGAYWYGQKSFHYDPEKLSAILELLTKVSKSLNSDNLTEKLIEEGTEKKVRFAPGS